MVYTLGELTLLAEPGSSGAQALYRGSVPVDLPPKAVSLLVLLAENAGKLVSRDQIRDAIWPGEHVEEANVTRHVSLVRMCLREHLGEGDHLLRVPKQGYQLAVPVTRSAPPTASNRVATSAESLPLAATALASSRTAPTRILLSAAAGAILAAAAVLLIVHRQASSAALSPESAPMLADETTPPVAARAAPGKSIAVLPVLIPGVSTREGANFAGAVQIVEATSLANGSIDTVSPEQIATVAREFRLPRQVDAALSATLGRRLLSDYLLTTTGSVHGPEVELTLSLLHPADGTTVASKTLRVHAPELAQQLPHAVTALLAVADVALNTSDATPDGLPSGTAMLEDTASAEALYDAGEYKQALAVALPVLKRSAASSHVHLLLANLYDAVGDYEKSATEARYALDTSKELKGAHRIAVQARAEALLISWPSAIGAYSRLHTEFPRNVDFALALADAYETSEMHKTATATLHSVAGLHDPRVDADLADIAAAKYAWTDALNHAQEEFQHAQAIGASTEESEAYARICRAKARLSNYEEALPACDSALSIARTLADNRTVLFDLRMQSEALRLAGDVTLADKTAKRLALAQKTGSQIEVFESIIQKGFAAAGQKDFATAGENFRKADAMAVSMNNLTLEAESKGMLSYLANISHDDDALLDYATQDLNIARAIQNKRWEANALGYIGSAYSDKGDDNTARGYWQQAVVAARASGDNHAIYAMLHHLVNLETRQGHPDVAAKWKTEMDALPEDPVKQRTPHQVNPSTPKPDTLAPHA